MLRRNMCDKYLAPLYYSNVMKITVNGSTRVCEAPLMVADLLQRMALAGKKVAVERNGEIVPRGAHGSTLLADGDLLEIVVAVGGG
jgi:sulfur carrier protein